MTEKRFNYIKIRLSLAQLEKYKITKKILKTILLLQTESKYIISS